MSGAPDLQREALRQQQLIRALWRRTGDATLAAWVRESGDHAALAVAAYRGNAAAAADRALAQAFPTVRQLVGDESFAILAKAFWHRCAPLHGDLAQLGAELPGFIEADPQLACEPYLADLARVDWAVHRIEQAADVGGPPPGLQRLASHEPDQIWLVLRPGITVLRSNWPVASIWRAHRSDHADRFASVHAALDQGVAEDALVWRDGWRGTVDAVDSAQLAFAQALLDGSPLAVALDRAGDAFSFERWLHDALARHWLVAVTGST
jgi:Putative DNA-binding domain